MQGSVKVVQPRAHVVMQYPHRLVCRHRPCRAYDRLYAQVTFTCPALGELGYFLLTLCLISIYVLEQQGHVRRSLLAKLQAALQAGPASDAAAGQLTEAEEDRAGANSTHLTCPLIPHHVQQDGGTEAQWVSVMWGLLLGCMSGVCSGEAGQHSRWTMLVMLNGLAVPCRQL